MNISYIVLDIGTLEYEVIKKLLNQSLASRSMTE